MKDKPPYGSEDYNSKRGLRQLQIPGQPTDSKSSEYKQQRE